MANTFREWCRAEALESSGDIEQLKTTRIAIDAEDYLNTLLTTSTREPLLPALGGLPFGLKKRVDEDVQHFRDAEIEVLFVFNGLDVAAKDRHGTAREAMKAGKVLNDAWSIYDLGRGDDAVAKFGQACTYRTSHIVRWLHTHLHNSGVLVQTAPYTAAAQIVQIEQDNFVNALVGSANLLVFGAERIVTAFDWDAERFTWVELRSCLKKTRFQKDQFVDLMLLSGCSFIPAIPETDLDPNASRITVARTIMARASQDGHSACLQSKDDEYLAAFRKAKYVVKHPVVISADGSIEPKQGEALPNDAHEFVGQRLPEEVYFYLTRGVVGPRVLNWRTRMQIFETAPLDGGSSQAYKDLVQEKLRPLRTQALALLTRPLHRYYQKTDVDLVCWFNESEKRALKIPDRTDILEQTPIPADAWRVLDADLSSSDNNSFRQTITFAMNFLADDATADKTAVAKSEPSRATLTSLKELLSNTTFRFLQDRGYIDQGHRLSAWGRALKVALDDAHGAVFSTSEEVTPDSEMEEAILMAFELLRLDVLNSKKLFQSPPYSGAPMRGSETDKANTLLVSRIACLGTLQHKAIGYTGPLSRHLLAYHQIAAAVRNSLRDLVEIHAAYMLLSGAVDRSLSTKQLTDLSTSLPFVREPDLGLALVVKSHLDELSNAANKRSDVTKWFKHATDIQGDLEKAWRMWNAINAGFQAADSSIVSADTKKTFRNADEWLKTKREQARPQTPNGTS